MSKEELYRQVTVEKDYNGAKVSRTFWGQNKYAVVGRSVKIEEDDGKWSEGWEVKAVWGEPLAEKLVKHRSHDHTRQRNCSDI